MINKIILKDSFLSALLAFIMSIPLLGVKIISEEGKLSLESRLLWPLWTALTVFIIKYLALIVPKKNRKNNESFLRLLIGKNSLTHSVSVFLIILSIVLPILPFVDRNIIDKAILLLIYLMLGWGLNIVVGLAGLLDLGYVAFYAVGAYSYALLSRDYGLSFWICLPLAGILSAFAGILLGFPVLRLRGDYLAIVTLGFGEIVQTCLINLENITGGPAGLSGIARPSFFGMSFLSHQEGKITFHEFFNIPFSPSHRVIFLYYIILSLALLTNFFTIRIRKLPIGRAWEALREDEIACCALGINPTGIKLSAFALGAMFAGFSGCFFATRQGFISPESFSFIESAIILAIVVLGGIGSQLGIVLACFILIGLPEWFREFQNYRMLAFGASMILIMLWRPEGLVSKREPTVKAPLL